MRQCRFPCLAGGRRTCDRAEWKAAPNDVREPPGVERCAVPYDGVFERVRGRGVEVEGDGWDDWNCAVGRGCAWCV